MNVLVTGGAGYIGSHAVLRLLEGGRSVTVVDDLCRGNRGAIDAIEGSVRGDLRFVEGDLGDRALVEPLLRERRIDVVMHFGALAYVGESMEAPLRYYRANAAAAVGLLEAMDGAGVRRIVLSSTCATYGEPSPEEIPIRETCPQQPISPYGRSKLFVEHLFFDHASAESAAGRPFTVAALRYFNVAGSDAKARIGEDHRPETHLIPICLEAALGRRAGVTIFGSDYPTPDGTCIRDYVHVDDLVEAHIALLDASQSAPVRAYNVGIGRGWSVREVVEACRKVTGSRFDVREGPRRPGDPPVLFADPARITTELRWRAAHGEIETMIESAWRWKRAHPEGYAR